MDHSLFALTKVVAGLLHLPYQNWLHPYYLIAGVLALGLFLLVLRRPLFNQLLFIITMAVLLPPNSFDYTLVYLYLPWALLCLVAFRAQRLGLTIPGLTPFFLCFVPLFTPFSLFVRHDVRFGGQVQTLCLCALIGFAVLLPIPDELWQRTDDSKPSTLVDPVSTVA